MVELTMLGIDVPIGPLRVYHDDGFVDHINKHSREVDESYDVRDVHTTHPAGRYLIRKRGDVTHYHIFYLDLGSGPNAFVRGHEETHMLDHFDSLDLLAERILDEMGLSVNFTDIEDSELIANIGGIYSLLRADFSINALYSLMFPGFIKAKKKMFGTLK